MKRTPLKRKRAKPRRTRLPRCEVQRCNRIARHVGLCKTHAKKKADKIFADQVKAGGRCHVEKDFVAWFGPRFDCKGSLQCAHLISRRYLNVRWLPANARPLCAAHHLWLDTHPVEKDRILATWADYEWLKWLALDTETDWRVAMTEILEADDE